MIKFRIGQRVRDMVLNRHGIVVNPSNGDGCTILDLSSYSIWTQSLEKLEPVNRSLYGHEALLAMLLDGAAIRDIDWGSDGGFVRAEGKRIIDENGSEICIFSLDWDSSWEIIPNALGFKQLMSQIRPGEYATSRLYPGRKFHMKDDGLMEIPVDSMDRFMNQATFTIHKGDK